MLHRRSDVSTSRWVAPLVALRRESDGEAATRKELTHLSRGYRRAEARCWVIPATSSLASVREGIERRASSNAPLPAATRCSGAGASAPRAACAKSQASGGWRSRRSEDGDRLIKRRRMSPCS
uniref:Uncharacterized protein n=1 Tax=Arundo donax TaxID=35708 RepID=A0A0A9BIX8_ARUDO